MLVNEQYCTHKLYCSLTGEVAARLAEFAKYGQQNAAA
jgi:hypothetical protein